MTAHPLKTRRNDDPDGAARLQSARREGRLRTIFYSAIVAGLVSLAVVRVGDVQNFNSQVDRNRKNCQLLQDDRRDRALEAARQAQTVLGDPNHNPPIPPANFNSPEFVAFRPLRKLLISQAKESRARSLRIEARVENCAKVFPKRSTFPIIG